ncbi:MAG TPA: VOC family protein [Candidatus Limnocylindria bacterium]|jgi:catechol 2,3-dioxygenase-like lactoylglutathione lyase family enzyme|nr:VOC family protein [Candidatus Limnocylindria bacterium]
MTQQTTTRADTSWTPTLIDAITLFVEDLPAAREFYRRAFALPVHFEDEHSAVFRFGPTVINLLQIEQAPELVAPAGVAPIDSGVRVQFTIGVEDVDATCRLLEERGVELLNGPMDRPWGVRTATFRDPAGHVWEIGA